MEYVLGLIIIILGWMFWSNTTDYQKLNKKYLEVENECKIWKDRAFNNVNEFQKEKRDLAQKVLRDAQIEAQHIIDEANERYELASQTAKLVEQITKNKISQFPIVATIVADLETAHEENRAKQLETKRNPAINGAMELRRIKQEKRNLIAENKAYKWELQYLRKLIPWIEELEDEIMKPQQNYINWDDNSTSLKDNATYYLSPDEYNSLSTAEKYQLALNRYKKRNKTNAEIGRDYERYIGYVFEKEGYIVEYFGIEKNVEDLGRDLICTKGNKIYVVQCKCWSNIQNKKIHEKHINQLYGTAMKYYLDYKRQLSKHRQDNLQLGTFSENLFATMIIPLFMSTVPYSDTAIEFAEALGIETKIEPMRDYPCIKCNINSKGERIYHLPFDQQYDKCQIKNKGEFFAMTVAEAELAGFRRAMRWSGNNNKNN